MLNLRPRRGLALPHRELEAWPALPAPPSRLLLPLRHSRLDQSEPVVRPGQRVAAGEPLSLPLGLAARVVCSPLAGRVRRVDVLSVVHPPLRDGSPRGALPVPCVELDELSAPSLEERTDWQQLERPALLERLRPWGLTGAEGLPLDLELELLSGEARLLVLGVAPAQALQDALLEQVPAALARAVTALCRLHGFRELLLACPPVHSEARRRWLALLEPILPARCVVLRQGHPWDQPRLAALALGRPLPSPRRPLAAQGLLALTLDQLAALELRLSTGLPLPPLVCQLDDLPEPHGLPQPRSCRVLRAWPGTPLSELDPALPQPGEWLVAGLPLEGSPLLEGGTPLLPGHTLLSRLPRLKSPEAEEACIHCGQCLDICPMRLAPIRLVRLAGEERLEEARGLGLEHCVHCGLCSWICPSRVELEDGLRRARQRLREARHGG
ncbi:MAG: 4Fe-4S dicluster domain-containing protein [Candidatus Delongbacteria bacterium]